jgi:outer membrane protein
MRIARTLAAADCLAALLLSLGPGTGRLRAQAAAAPVPVIARGGPSSDTLRLDLDRSIALALERASAVLLGRESVRLSGSALLEAYGRFLPDARAGAGAFSESGNLLLSSTALRASSASFYGAAFTLSTGINLFNGLRDREHLRAALLEREGAQSSLERARQQVAYDVTQAYYQVVLDRRLESVARATLELSTTRERQLTEQVNAGTRAPPDLYRQQAQTRFDESALIDAVNRVHADEYGLLRRLREAPMRPRVIAEPPADTTPLEAAALSPRALLARALDARPDLAAARQRLEADAHESRAAEGARLPRVVAGFDWVGAGRVFDRETVGGINQLTVEQKGLLPQLGSQGYFVGSLGLSWDLFDRWRSRLDIDRAAAFTYRDRLAAEDLQLQIESEVQRAVDDYRSTRDRLTASAAGLRAAEEAFAAVQGRYDAGLATFVDVLSAQSALTQARALHEQSVTGLALQKAVLRYVAGEAR